MKKHLAHLAAALAVTLLFGAAAGPLSAAAAAPTAILDEENTAAAESRLNQSWLDMEIEYNDRNPVYQLYLSSAAPTTGCTSGTAPTPLWRRWTATAS